MIFIRLLLPLVLPLMWAQTSLAAEDNNWSTYPQVPKTASINGFADPIYDLLPKCAKNCVKAATGNTPCPYWDTGCLCVMPQWSGMVAQCIADNCKGKNVDSATSLAYSLCSSVGANLWLMPASVTSALTKAAGNKMVNSADPSHTEWNYLLSGAESRQKEESSRSATAKGSSNGGVQLGGNLAGGFLFGLATLVGILL